MKKISAVILCLFFAGCSQVEPEIITQKMEWTREDITGIYTTEYYTTEKGVDGKPYTKIPGDEDEGKFVHPGSEAIVELRDDGTVFYGCGERKISKVGTWTYDGEEVIIDTPDISNDMHEGIVIYHIGSEMTVNYGYSGIPHVKTSYVMTKLNTEYIAGKYILKSGMADGEYYRTEDGTAKAEDVSLELSENGTFIYNRADRETPLEGAWSVEGRFIVTDTAEDITIEAANGKVFVITENESRVEMLIKQ